MSGLAPPLLGFLEVLRAEGLLVGVDDHLAVQGLLATAQDWTPDRLRLVLRAAVARTREEQARFDAAFERWFFEPAAPPSTVPPPPASRRRVLPALGGVAAALALVVWLVQPREPTPPPAPDAALATRTDAGPADAGAGADGGATDEPAGRPAEVHPVADPAWWRPPPPRRGVGTLLLALAPILLGLAGFLLWRRRRETRGGLQLAGPYTFEPRLRPADEARLLEAQALEDLASVLNFRSVVAFARELDPERTVQATIDAGGIPALVHRRAPPAPSYLVLLDQSERAAAVSGVFERVFAQLGAAGLSCAVLHFRGSPEVCTSPTRPGVRLPLGALAGRGFDALVVVGDPRGAWRPGTDDAAPWVRALQRFPERLWLHPLPIERWDRGAATVQRAGRTRVLPASLGALRLAHPDENVVRDDDLGPAWAPIWEELPAEEAGSVEGLRAFLGEAFPAACAATLLPRLGGPEVAWLVERHFPRLSADARVRLLGLPWVTARRWPDGLRAGLRAALSDDLARRVRESIRAALQDQAPAPQSLAHLRWRLADLEQQAWLDPDAAERRLEALEAAHPEIDELVRGSDGLRDWLARPGARQAGFALVEQLGRIYAGRPAPGALRGAAAAGAVAAALAAAVFWWWATPPAPPAAAPEAVIWRLEPAGLRLAPTVVRASGPVRAQLGPEERLVATVADNGRIDLWDPGSGGWIGALAQAEPGLSAVALAPGFDRIAVAVPDKERTVRVRAPGEAPQQLAPHPAVVRTLLFSPDGRYLLAAGEQGPTTVWDVREGARRFAVEGEATAWAFTADGGLAVGRPDGRVALYGPDGDPRGELAGAGRPGVLRFLAERRLLVGADGVTLWALEPPRALWRAETGGPVTALAWEPVERHLVAGDAAGGLTVLDESGAALQRSPGTAAVRSLALRGGQAFAGLADGAVRVLDLASGAARTHAAHRHAVTTVLAPAGRPWVITGSEDWSAAVLTPAPERWQRGAGPWVRVADGRLRVGGGDAGDWPATAPRDAFAGSPTAVVTLPAEASLAEVRPLLHSLLEGGVRRIYAGVAGAWGLRAVPLDLRPADAPRLPPPPLTGEPGLERLLLHADRAGAAIEVEAAAELRRLDPDYVRIRGSEGGCRLFALIPEQLEATGDDWPTIARRRVAHGMRRFRVRGPETVVRAGDAVDWATLVALAATAEDFVAHRLTLELALPDLSAVDCPGAVTVNELNQIRPLKDEAPTATATAVVLVLPSVDARPDLRRDERAIDLAFFLKGFGYDVRNVHAYPGEGPPADPLAGARRHGEVRHDPKHAAAAQALAHKLRGQFPDLQVRPFEDGDLRFGAELEVYAPLADRP